MPWRPLFEMMYAYGLEPSAAYEGGQMFSMDSQLLPVGCCASSGGLTYARWAGARCS